MISFQLNDINDGPLREAAAELKITGATTLAKADLIVAIKDKAFPNQPLTLVPAAAAPEVKSWWSPAIIIALLSMILSLTSAGITWWGTSNTVGKIYNDLDQEKTTTWKMIKVYEIISKNTLSHEKWKGLTFDEIRTLYTIEANAVTNVHINKDDLQVDSLLKILFELDRNRLISKTIDDKYIISRVYAAPKDCAFRPSTETVERAVLQVLRTEAGKYTVEKLAEKVKNETKLDSEDVYASLNCMIARQMAYAGTNGMIYPAAEPPKPMASHEKAPTPLTKEPSKQIPDKKKDDKE